jgi:hypothetical protein
MNNQIIRFNENTNSFITLEAGKNELNPELIRNSISGIEKAMLGLPNESKLGLETMHTFTDGVYVRTVLMKAGSLITGKIHKLEHTVIISQGAASIVSEDGGAKFLTAPMVFISPANVKRLLFIQQDMVFTTVHKNPDNIRDLDRLEELLMLPDYEMATEGETV